MVEVREQSEQPLWASWEESVAFDGAGATVRTVGEGQGSKTFVVGLEPGQVLPTHPAPEDLCLLVVQGDVNLVASEERRPCRSGDVVQMRAGVPHSIENGDSTRAVVVGVLRKHP
ncbi:MAG: cupin domain-containing protein [Actinomycetota bacterium]|nr:cupin domain-containing protein [Actinomycetota bacterium]